MKTILFIFLIGDQAVEIESTEFESLEACELAREAVTKIIQHRNDALPTPARYRLDTVCVYADAGIPD